jgi:hypothetical protein
MRVNSTGLPVVMISASADIRGDRVKEKIRCGRDGKQLSARNPHLVDISI